MACKWVTNDSGDIIGAEDKSGNNSELFQGLKNKFGLESAIEMYAVSQSDNFMEIFQEEPSVEDLLQYITEQNATQEELTRENLLDLQDFKDFNKQKLIDTFYDGSIFIVDEQKLIDSGLYNSYEARNLVNDIKLQEKVKNSIERLKNTETEELPIKDSLEVTAEINSFGKMRAISEDDINKSLREALAGVESREEFDAILEELPYEVEDKDTLYNEMSNLVKAEAYIVEDGKIRRKRNTETALTLPLVAKESDNLDIIKHIKERGIITEETLQMFEDDLIEDGIDVIGLANKPLNEETFMFLDTLADFLINPNKENTKIFAEVLDSFFSRDLAETTEILQKNPDVILAHLDTTLSEEEVYNQVGFIKTDTPNQWIQTNKQDLETLYQNLETYGNKNLRKEVQQEISQLEGFENAEVAEAVTLYKKYFNIRKLEVQLVKDKNGNLLAPNGKISNLNEEQWKLVRTPEFKAWFGDWVNDPQNASKVVDENEEPKVLYHSTNEDFTEFDTARIGKNYTPHYGAGFYFADSYRGAMEYGGKLGFYFINIKNLKTYSYGFKYESQEKGFQDVADYSKNLGIDGLVYGEEYKQYIVFTPNQIKSATEIKGITAEETNDIRFLKAITPTKTVKNFTGNQEYLTNEYVSDFYTDLLKEKQKNSRKYKDFYSNFGVNEKGLFVTGNLDRVKLYADENLKQYSILSKQMPDLSDTTENLASERDNLVNYPQTIEEYKGEIFKLNDNEIILKNNVEGFIRIDNDIFESVDIDGNINHFVKLEKNNSEYNIVNVKEPSSDVNIRDFDYLKDSNEDFISVKDYLKGSKPDQLNC